MQAAIGLHRRRDGLLPGRLVGDVERHERRALAELAREGAALGLVAVGQHGLAAFAQHQARGLGADAGGAAAHQHDLILEAQRTASSC